MNQGYNGAERRREQWIAILRVETVRCQFLFLRHGVADHVGGAVLAWGPFGVTLIWVSWGGAMDYRFNAQEWSGLSATERARRCRLMAGEAKKMAHTVKGSMRDNYLSIASDWEKLATEIERTAKL